jgi:hypothetical protein
LGDDPGSIGETVTSRAGCHLERRHSSARFDPNSIIDRRTNPLFAAEVAFRRLNGDMPQKELDLLQFSSRGVAESGTGRRSCGASFVSNNAVAPKIRLA